MISLQSAKRPQVRLEEDFQKLPARYVVGEIPEMDAISGLADLENVRLDSFYKRLLFDGDKLKSKDHYILAIIRPPYRQWEENN